MPESFKLLLVALTRDGDLYTTKISTIKSIFSDLYIKVGKPGLLPTYSYDWEHVGYMAHVNEDIFSNIEILKSQILEKNPAFLTLGIDRHIRAAKSAKLMGEAKHYLAAIFKKLWLAIDKYY